MALGSGSSFFWDQESFFFYELKDKLCTAEVSRRPDSAQPYVLATDWSQKGDDCCFEPNREKGKRTPGFICIQEL